MFSVANKVGGMPSNFLRSTVCRSKEFMLSLYVAHIRPLIEFSSCVWNTGYVGDLKLLESIQRRWTRHIDGLENTSYSHRLAILDLYSVRGRLIRADMIKMWKIFHDKCSITPSDLFVMAPNVGTRGHPFKVFRGHAVLEARRRFFSVRCIDVWNSLSPVKLCHLSVLIVLSLCFMLSCLIFCTVMLIRGCAIFCVVGLVLLMHACCCLLLVCWS